LARITLAWTLPTLSRIALTRALAALARIVLPRLALAGIALTGIALARIALTATAGADRLGRVLGIPHIVSFVIVLASFR
jgi:hypothetical protein